MFSLDVVACRRSVRVDRARCFNWVALRGRLGLTVAPTLLLDRFVVLVSSFVARLSLSLSLVAPSAV